MIEATIAMVKSEIRAGKQIVFLSIEMDNDEILRRISLIHKE